jgi:hypothetical protein
MAKRRRTDNTMAKRRRTDNTMAKRRKTDNTMAKRRRTDNTMAIRRRTDNTMAKRKETTRTNNDLQNIHIKQKIEPHQSHKKTADELRRPEKVSRSCSTSDTRRVTLVKI